MTTNFNLIQLPESNQQTFIRITATSAKDEKNVIQKSTNPTDQHHSNEFWLKKKTFYPKHTHAHAHRFNSQFPGKPGLAGFPINSCSPFNFILGNMETGC